jgi:hypothetical protein
LVALADIMRLSLKKGAHAALSSAAWQEIRGSVAQWRDLRFRLPETTRNSSNSA